MNEHTAFCDSVASRLEAIVSGSLNAGDLAAVNAHVTTCEDCRVLVELAREPLPTATTAAVSAPDLTAGVLARTSGSGCGRAGDLLCDLTDGALTGTSSDLLRLHLEICHGCRSLSAALTRLADTLPGMAERQPDEHFVDDVLARTLPLTARLRRWAAQLSERWGTLIQRPRFSWEAAYIGAIMLSLLFGAPASPLREVPKQALAMVQVNPFAGSGDGETLAVAGDFVWSWTGEPVLTVLGDLKNEVGTRYARTADERASFKSHTGELGRATLRMQGSDSLTALTGIGGDLKGIWHEMAMATENEDRKEGTNDD